MKLEQKNAEGTNGRLMEALRLHLPIILFGWFFLGMALCGLLAPYERVVELNSTVIGQGWHLSLLALTFGTAIITAYIWRLRQD